MGVCVDVVGLALLLADDSAGGGLLLDFTAAAVALAWTALDFLRMYGLKRHSMPWPEHLMPFLRHLKHSGSVLSQMTRRVRHSRQPGNGSY